MASKRDRKSVLLAAIEATSGVEESITASTDAIQVENLQINFQEGNQETNEVTNSLDGSDDIPIGGPVTVTFDTWVKGNGTPGTAPEIGKLLKAGGWSETVTASAIGAPTAATAGTTSSATVPNETFDGANDAYNGMLAQLSGNPATTQFAAILDWVNSTEVMSFAETFGSALSTSTLVQIPANVLYGPQSGTIPTLTMTPFKDGIKHTIIGASADFNLTMESGRGSRFSWTCQGIFAGSRTDTSNPAVTYPDAASPKLVWKNDNSNGGMLLDGVRIGVTALTLGSNNTLDNAPNPNQVDGFDITDIAARNLRGSINPRLASIATRDLLAAKQAGTKSAISAFMGRAAGNRFAVTIPSAQWVNYGYENQNQLLGENLPFKATGPDAGAYLCFF